MNLHPLEAARFLRLTSSIMAQNLILSTLDFVHHFKAKIVSPHGFPKLERKFSKSALGFDIHWGITFMAELEILPRRKQHDFTIPLQTSFVYLPTRFFVVRNFRVFLDGLGSDPLLGQFFRRFMERLQ